MRLFTIAKWKFVLLLLSPVSYAYAGLIAGPGKAVTTDLKDVPKWLKEGKGDDGYVTVRANIDMGTDVACQNLGKSGFWGIGKESIQIVASVKSQGFSSVLDGQSLPLATFDSRTNPGGCTGLNTLPLTLISMARLEKYADGSPGKLALLFDIRSTASSNINLVATAQIALGAASVFATGGAATTVTTLSATLAKPALQSFEAKVNEERANIFSGQSAVSFEWKDLRKGIQKITVPVYGGKAKKGSEKQIIDTLKANPDPKVKLFDIVLTMFYHRSIFEDLSDASAVPSEENIIRSRVLSYPNWNEKPVGISLLQQLNGSSPSLLQDTASTKYTKEWKAVCDKVLGNLRTGGLNQLDRAIVLKTFIDEAKDGGDWYSSSNVGACLEGIKTIRADMERVYGMPGKDFTYGDTVTGTGLDYLTWKYDVAPTLSRVKQALIMKEAKSQVLSSVLSDKATVHFYPDARAWLNGSETAPTEGIDRLAVRDIRRGGCFVYADDTELDRKNGYGAHMILVGANDDFWHAQIKMVPNNPSAISSIVIESLNDDWKTYFKSKTYSGGDCSNILKNL